MPPKYKRLADVLRDNIKKKLAPGDRLPTRRELMERHAVSLSTVEGALRILSDEQLISCHVGRGTFVSNKAIKKNGDSGRICMISTLSGQFIASNWHQGPIFEGIQSVLEEAGLRLMLSDYDGIEDTSHYSDFSGLIFLAPQEDKKALIKKFQDIGVPSVVICTSWDDVNIPSIDCDNEYGIRCMLRYLADRGHTRIGYVDQIFQSFDALSRRAAFEKMIDEFGIEARWSITIGSGKLDDEALSGLRAMFASEDRPTALIFSSFIFSTMQVAAELKSMGVSIPQDVSLIGFDDSPWASCIDPKLTVIKQPLSTMGQRAAERLIAQIKGKAFVKNEILPIELIERDSVAMIKSPHVECVQNIK
ncbi:MAG: GntR family transcriptional regulator [Synergistaceae bacterium]|nr:GntR family transcriptional regulator [Synergistaceae bacterium]